jgi:putative metallohydrolase (TIGR04338 family)
VTGPAPADVSRPGRRPRSCGPPDRDGQRSRVYRAEDAWAARLDAARRGAALATVGGSSVLLPAERRFGTLEAAADYAAAVLALPDVAAAAPGIAPPALRVRRGVTAAHWEPPGVIALPVPAHGEPWAMRECVLLHELAHHVATLTGRARGHRPPFPAVLLLLVEAALGPEAALALRVDYGREAVETGSL